MKKLALLLAICWGALLVSGCGPRNSDIFAERAKPCIEAGGVPLQSAWNSQVVTECRFPPKVN